MKYLCAMGPAKIKPTTAMYDYDEDDDEKDFLFEPAKLVLLSLSLFLPLLAGLVWGVVRRGLHFLFHSFLDNSPFAFLFSHRFSASGAV
jgi:hypothetical protein